MGTDIMFRSTKGASKQRRDLINLEIGNLRDILPLPESSRQRLSQLQIMSLACCYVRKANYFTRLFGENGSNPEQPFEFSQTLTGFLLILTREGKLLYISENITEHLGHSMVDMMTQGDSIFDIIDKRDHSMVQSQLSAGPPSNGEGEEKTFFCRMNVSRSFRRQAGFGDHKVMHVRGHYVQPMIRDHYGNQPVFMALCSPLVTPDVKDCIVQNDTMSFQTVHGLNMKFLEVSANGEYHLGYRDSELYNQSWYERIHPEDAKEAREKHTQLIKSSRELGCMLTIRLQSASGSWVWVNTVMYLRQPFLGDNADPVIVCLNQVITEAEAPHFRLQSQLYSSHIARSPEFLSSSQGGSPSHVITQVAMEPESLNMSYQVQPMMSSPISQGYHDVNIPSSGDPNMTGGMPHMGQYSGNNAGGYSPSTDHKQILRADILSRLKRKMSQSTQAQCKPNKVPRLQESQNGFGTQDGMGGGVMLTGTAFMAHASFFADSYESSSGGGGGGGVDVMGRVADVPVFAQLGIKEEVIGRPLDCMKQVANSTASVIDFQPPTPPTPSPSQSSMTSTDITETRLTVDTSVCEGVVIPPSILTPESCASFSPSHSITDENTSSKHLAASEQTVPTALIDDEDQFSSELDFLLPEMDRKRRRPPPPYQPPEELPPELDMACLDSFLAAVDTVEQKYILNRALDMALTSSKLDGVSAGSPMVAAPTVNEEVCASDLNTVPDLNLADITPDQVDILLATVGDSLQGLVTDQELLGQFMLVPTAGGESRDAGRPGDLLDGTQHLMQELSTLNELAALSPSHGDDVVSTSSVDPSL